MTTKGDYLAITRNNFANNFGPSRADYYNRGDFEIQLDRLIYAAIALGQEPFMRELELYRDITLSTATLKAQKDT